MILLRCFISMILISFEHANTFQLPFDILDLATIYQSGILNLVQCDKTQCFSEFGCFSADEFIEEVKEIILAKTKAKDSLQTSVALKILLSICPVNPREMNVTFIMFTPDNPTHGRPYHYNSTDEELKSSGFSAQKKTVFIVHGFTDYYAECEFAKCAWMANMKNFFLNESHNVVTVDWSKIAVSYSYFTPAFNTRITGSLIAFFIRRLIAVFGIKPESIHLIGHSLGAQACGWAGKRFNGKDGRIGQITALDPAGPGFSRERLSPNDALLVVASHTSAGFVKTVDTNIGENVQSLISGDNPLELIQLSGFLGMPESLGHIDIWPNGGNGQPGCEKFSNKFLDTVRTGGFAGIKERAACSHNRATFLPVEVEHDDCQMVAYRCPTYDDFIEGKCADCGQDGQNCVSLHFKGNNQKDIVHKNQTMNYYLRTGDEQPFCIYQYQLTIWVSHTSNMSSIAIKLYGRNDTTAVLYSPNDGFIAGRNYTKLVTSHEHLGLVTRAAIDFDFFTQLSRLYQNPIDALSAYNFLPSLSKIKVRYLSNMNASIREKYSSELEPMSPSRIFTIIKNHTISAVNTNGTVHPECQRIGYKCDSMRDYTDGKCVDCGETGSMCGPVSFDRDYYDNDTQVLTDKDKYLYVKTLDEPPYCLHNYQITVTFAEYTLARTVILTLIGAKHAYVALESPIIGFMGGMGYTKLLATTEHLGIVTAADVDHEDNIYQRLKLALRPEWKSTRTPRIQRVVVKYLSNVEAKTRDKYHAELVPEEGNWQRLRRA